MKEHPILFTGEMVRAILAGHKTQTRRVIRPQPIFSNVACGEPTLEERVYQEAQWLIENRCPYGVPGDQLWVRETFLQRYYGWSDSEAGEYHSTWLKQAEYFSDGAKTRPGWAKRPSIFMPRWASRITLEVREVRVQRVQDMRLGDFIDEGVQQDGSFLGSTNRYRHAFIDLWDSINAGRGYAWDSNPWVWALTFERIAP